MEECAVSFRELLTLKGCSIIVLICTITIITTIRISIIVAVSCCSRELTETPATSSSLTSARWVATSGQRHVAVI